MIADPLLNLTDQLQNVRRGGAAQIDHKARVLFGHGGVADAEAPLRSR